MDMRDALRNGSEEMQQIFRELGAQMNARAEKEREQKVRNYRSLNARAEKGQILFTGSSLMEQFPIAELALALKLDKKVYNRGIGGFTTEDFLREIDTVLFDLDPSVVFMNIGTNDFREWPDGRDWKNSLLKNYEDILRHCKERLPDSKFYLMAYYPVNGELPDAEPGAVFMLKVRTNENLADVNQEIAKLATRYGYEFIPASNEPSSRACTDIWRMPRGSNTSQLYCASSLIPRQLAAGYLIYLCGCLSDSTGENYSGYFLVLIFK